MWSLKQFIGIGMQNMYKGRQAKYGVKGALYFGI